MINLLPEQEKRLFKRTYMLRLATVAFFVAAVLVIIHGVLLIPSYAFLQARVLEQESEKNLLGRTLEASGSTEVEERLSTLTETIDLLKTLPETPSLVRAVEYVLQVSRTNIQVTQISFEPSTETAIQVRGVAGTREALQGYVQRLEQQEGVAKVEFPIGNLSRQKDLPFTISIQLAS